MRRLAILAALFLLGMAAPARAGNSGIWVPALEVLSVSVTRDAAYPDRVAIRVRGIGPESGYAEPTLRIVREATGDAGHLQLRLMFDVKRHGFAAHDRYDTLPRMTGEAALSLTAADFRYRRVTAIARDNRVSVAVDLPPPPAR